MAKTEKPKGGRPSKYSEALVEAICARLATGEPLAVICRDEGMAAYRTVKDWQDSNPAVSAAIARAREEGHDAIAADCLIIADYKADDVRIAEGKLIVDHELVQRSKLRIDTRLKLLAKWDPKRYGDKVQLADADGNKVETPILTVTLVRPQE